jgi:hypothetical protein
MLRAIWPAERETGHVGVLRDIPGGLNVLWQDGPSFGNRLVGLLPE